MTSSKWYIPRDRYMGPDPAQKRVDHELYERVASGAETARVISACGRPDYKQLLGKELGVMGNSEMWQAGKATRALRPKASARKITKSTKGVAGRKIG